MRILINHLTRMQPGYVCVAGLDGNARHVRPVAGRLRRQIVSVDGGPFDLGSIVDIGAATPHGAAPEWEDHSFVVEQARLVTVVGGEEFWETIEGVARPSLQGIFGQELVRRWSSATVDVGQGDASLGVLRPRGRVSINRRSQTSLRILLSDADLGDLDLSLTDLRFVDSAHLHVDEDAFEEAAERLQRREPVLLSVGLGRAWMANADTAERHWLQVNNLHFNNHSDWRLDNP